MPLLQPRLSRLEERLRHLLPPVQVAAYDRFLAELQARGVTDNALGVGQAMPDFRLPNAEGHLVDSRALRAAGPLVISFFRGHWCPYCTLELLALQDVLPEIARRGASLLAISPEQGGRALALKRREGLTFDLLCDVDNGVGVQFGVVFQVSEPVKAHYEDNGIDLAAFHGNPGWLLPIPATYVVDRAGVIRHAFLDPDYVHRLEPAVILEVLQQLSHGEQTGESGVITGAGA